MRWTIAIEDRCEPNNTPPVASFLATIIDEGDFELGTGEGSTPEEAVADATTRMRTSLTARRERIEVLTAEGRDPGVQFEITYVMPNRPKRIVGEEHFARSIIGRTTSKLAVGESTGAQFRSAGYKSIKRVS